MGRGFLQMGAILWIATAGAQLSCTTFVQPTACDRGSTACAGMHDARFCDDVAVAVEGADCDALGIVAKRHFCVVAASACVDTNYAVKNRDCKVVRYQTVRDSAREDCAPGTPTFVSR